MASTPILILSARWQTRALLAAQIGEVTGCDAISAPGVDEALALVKAAGIDPALLVVDAGQQLTPGDVERLALALPQTPIALIVSAPRRAAFDSLREHCAVYLVRPVSIGQIADAAKQVLESTDH